ncbi:MAG: glycosyltransferase family 2 protein [Phycisphaerales bacterium]
MSTRLSVVIPLFGGEGLIGRALGSLLEQREQSWEAIVVDDGSTDRGPEEARSFAVQDERVRVVTQLNGGVCRARNRGLDEARGEFVLFLDADDWMLPGGVDLLLAVAREHGAAVCPFELHGEQAGLISTDGPWSPWIGEQELLGGIFMVTHGHVVARSACAGLRFDESLTHIEDTDMWLRLAARGVRWRNAGAAGAVYGVRPTSRSAAFGAMLGCTERVYGRAYAGARDRGFVDASAERLGRTLAGSAMGYGTRMAISGRPGALGLAVELLRSQPRVGTFSPRQLARTAQHAVIFAHACGPTVEMEGRPSPAWWPDLLAWWGAGMEEGVATVEGIGEAQVLFRSGLLTGPGDAAAARAGAGAAAVGRDVRKPQPAFVFGRSTSA